MTSPLSDANVITPEVQKRNALNVQIDAVGIGIANAASPFLPVFLTRAGASNNEVGLLTSMPGVTGLVLALFIGNFLQGRKNIVPWFSFARLLVISCYALTGLIPFFVSNRLVVIAVLVIWAAATLPQTMLNVSFSVVMNAVAGPEGRYALMSRRWSILGVTTAITVLIVGQILDRITFPHNYQLAFLALSVGGLVSYYFSSRIKLPDHASLPPAPSHSLLGAVAANLRETARLLKGQPAFLSFILKRFVYLSGITLAAPLFPLYYVRVVNAPDKWIGFISTAQTFVLVIGYWFWSRQSRRRGSRFVLLASTLGIAIYPALVALTQRLELIALYAALAGIVQAGIDLVFFDELMKKVPPEYSATFVAVAQSLQYLSSIAAPLVGTYLADAIGIGGGLIVSSAIRLLGFALFLFGGVKAGKGAGE